MSAVSQFGFVLVQVFVIPEHAGMTNEGQFLIAIQPELAQIRAFLAILDK
jgi:hypothetical protein